MWITGNYFVASWENGQIKLAAFGRLEQALYAAKHVLQAAVYRYRGGEWILVAEFEGGVEVLQEEHARGG
ncbi:MAG: hypothetical protein KatS3mg109_1318 [Pirellulaceae bacterium]|nr:MAG: hypothetical protein KatS3mg109_1318 [Pirellulaceae bacterium]